jgi:hypothetical protein
MRHDRYIIIAALVAVILVSMGCVSAGKPSQQAMDAANVTADRMLNAINAGDYEGFTQNFSSTMRSAVGENRFNEIKSNMTDAYGKYVSRAPIPTTTTVQGYNVFLYDCQFEKSKVTVQLAMNPSDVWAVEGFYYR